MKPSKGPVLAEWDTIIAVSLPVGIWLNLAKYVCHCHDDRGIRCADEEMCIAIHTVGSAVNTVFQDMRFESENKIGGKK